MTEPVLTVSCDASGNVVANAPDGRRLAIACASATPDFDSTELLLAALGGCIAASVTPLLQRHGHHADDLELRLFIGAQPLQDVISVHIALPPLEDAVMQRCRRAVQNCPVLRALRTPVNIQWQAD